MGEPRRGVLHPITAVAAGALAVVLAACSPAGGQTGGSGANSAQPQATGTQTVEFWTVNLKSKFGSYVEGVIKGFEAKNPSVKVKWVDAPGIDMSTKLLAALASGNPPDAVNLASSEVDKFVPALADLGQYIPADKQKAYSANLIDSLRRNGKLIAIPWYNAGPPILIYNKEVFQKAGANAAPTTIADGLKVGVDIYAKTGIYGVGDFPSYTVLEQMGVNLLSDDHKKAAFNTPEAAAQIQKWVDAFKAKGVVPDILVPDPALRQQTVGNGQVAMEMQVGGFQLKSYEENAPDVFAKLDVAPAATGVDGKYYLPGQQTFVIPAKSTKQKAAADLIAYFTTAENQLAFAKLVSIFPSTPETLKDPLFTRGGTTLADKARAVSVKEMPKLFDGALGTGVDHQLSDFFDVAMRDALSGKKSPAQALDAAASEWDKVLATVGK
jgi:ABC-type glycerol-3-phosphate transport system substrate-binding protein